MFVTARARLLGVTAVGLIAILALIGTVVFELGRLSSEHSHVVERVKAAGNAAVDEGIGERFSRIVGNAVIHNNLDKARAELATLTKAAESRLAELKSQSDNPEEQQEAAEALEHIHTIESVINTRLLPLLEDASPMEEAVRVASEDIDEHINAIHAILEKFVAASQNEASATEAAFSQTESNTIIFVLVIGAIAAIVTMTLSLRVSRFIVKSLDTTNGITKRISQGDLSETLQVTGRDEFAQVLASCATMQANLRTIVSQLQQDATQIASMSLEFSSTTEQLSVATDHQAEAASSMAASVEELSVSITHMSDQANDVRSSSTESGSAARNGVAVIDQLLAENEHTSSSVESAAKRVEELGRLSSEVTSVVKVIREVAEQTNLLALNAAIEAARAGEQGRGFAVVADEVRKLAERTGQSTHEITQTIGEIQSVVEEVASEMKNAVNQVRGGEALSQQARQSITEIGARAESVMMAVEEINNALREQSTASADIAIQVEHIATASEENSAAVRSTASGAKHLEEVSTRLRSAAGQFRLA
jgi:methyl-accepting chemotaxis protein